MTKFYSWVKLYNVADSSRKFIKMGSTKSYRHLYPIAFSNTKLVIMKTAEIHKT